MRNLNRKLSSGRRRLDGRDFLEALRDLEDSGLDERDRRQLLQAFSDERGHAHYADLVRCVEKERGSSPRPYRINEDAEVSSHAAARTLREGLRQCVREGCDYRACLEAFDEQNTGCVSRAQFEAALRELSIELPRTDVDALCARYAASSAGAATVQYVELLNSVLPVRPALGEQWRVEERLRAMVRARFHEWRVPGRLKRAFRHFDVSKMGAVKEKELAEGLRALKLKLSAEQEHSLFKAMDLDSDGSVDLAEFIVFVRDPCHHFLQEKAKHALGQSRRESARTVCEQLDRTRSGLLGPRDFANALDQLKVLLTSSERRRLATRFDAQDDGNVSVSRFVAFSNGTVDTGLVEGSSRRPFREADPFAAHLGLLAEKRGRPLDFARLLREFDEDEDGKVDRRQLRSALESVGMELSAPQFASLFDRFERDEMVAIRDVARFAAKAQLKALPDFDDRGRASPRRQDRSSPRRTRDDDARSPKQQQRGQDRDEDGLTELRSELRRLAKRHGRLDLKRLFREFDRDGSGFLERKEFRRALESLGFEISSSTLTRVMDAFDADGDGRVSTREFVKFAQTEDPLLVTHHEEEEEEEPPVVVTLIERALRREVAKLARGSSTLRGAFAEFDRDDSGSISRREFRKELDRLGFDLSADEIDALFDHFDRDGDGRIAYAEFVRFCDAKGAAPSGKVDPEEIIQQLQELVRDAVQLDGLSVADVFEHFDADASGEVDEDEFRAGLKKLGIRLGNNEARAVMHTFQGKRSGRVKYRDFVKCVEPSRASSQRHASSPRRTRAPPPRDDARASPRRPHDDGLTELRSELRRLATRHGRLDFKRLFRDLDRDGSGELDRREFRKALESLGFEISSNTLTRVMDKFDADGDGKISTKEFVRFANTEEVAPRRDDDDDDDDRHRDARASSSGVDPDEVIAQLQDFVREAVNHDGLSLADCFEHFDADGSGEVDEDEFKSGLKKLGIRLSSPEARSVMRRFPGRRSGHVRYRDFVKAVRPNGASSSSRRATRSPRSARDRY